MAATLSDLRSRVKENCHNDGSISNARYDEWINLTQDDVERNFLARWISAKDSFLTVADQEEYELIIPDFRAFIQFWQTDSPVKLSHVPYEEFVRMVPDPSSSSSGRPRHWVFTRFTSGFPTVRLYPTPDAAYTIEFEYALNLPDLVNDTDVSLISQLGWASLLEKGATSRYYSLHSPEDAAFWHQLFREDMRMFKAEFKQAIRDRKMMVDVLGPAGVMVRDLFRFPDNFPAF